MTYNQTFFIYIFTIITTSFLSRILTNNKWFSSSKVINFKYKGYLHVYEYTRWWAVLLSFIPMIILAGTRINTGADYVQYTWNYSEMLLTNDVVSLIKNSREPLYIVSEYINILLFGNNVNYWFFNMAAITILILILALYKIDSNMDFCTFSLLFGLYVYLHMFNYVRQFFATSLVILGIAYALNEKKKSSIIAIFVATLMHQSSIVFLLLLIPIFNTKFLLNHKYHLIMLLSPFYLSIVVFILKKIPFFSIYVIRYFEVDLNMGLGWLIDVTPIIILYYLNHTIEFANNKKGKVLAELSWMIIPIRILSYYSYAAGRLYITFVIIGLIAFCSLVDCGSHRFLKKLFATIIIFSYFIFIFYIGNNSVVFPYMSFLL